MLEMTILSSVVSTASRQLTGNQNRAREPLASAVLDPPDSTGDECAADGGGGDAADEAVAGGAPERPQVMTATLAEVRPPGAPEDPAGWG